MNFLGSALVTFDFYKTFLNNDEFLQFLNTMNEHPIEETIKKFIINVQFSLLDPLFADIIDNSEFEDLLIDEKYEKKQRINNLIEKCVNYVFSKHPAWVDEEIMDLKLVPNKVESILGDYDPELINCVQDVYLLFNLNLNEILTTLVLPIKKVLDLEMDNKKTTELIIKLFFMRVNEILEYKTPYLQNHNKRKKDDPDLRDPKRPK